MQRRLVLVAGPSGSGKSRVVLASGLPQVRLDDFYHDHDHPGLPQTLGIPDWDDPATWNGEAAVAALAELLATGRTDTPDYSIPESRKVGAKQLTIPDDAALVLAEGIFADRGAAAGPRSRARRHGHLHRPSRGTGGLVPVPSRPEAEAQTAVGAGAAGARPLAGAGALKRKALASGFEPVSTPRPRRCWAPGRRPVDT